MTKPPLHNAIVAGVMSAFDAASAVESPWLIREANEDDRRGVFTLWLEQVWRSKVGRSYQYEGGRADFEKTHRPRLDAAFARSTTRLVCDPDEPHGRFFGFAIVEGDSVLHALLIKRQFHREGFSADMIRALLGDMLERRVVYTGRLADMLRQEVREQGLVVPEQWRFDAAALNDGMRRSA